MTTEPASNLRDQSENQPQLVAFVARHGVLLHAARVVPWCGGFQIQPLCRRVQSVTLGPNHCRKFFVYEPQTVLARNCETCKLIADDMALRYAVAS